MKGMGKTETVSARAAPIRVTVDCRLLRRLDREARRTGTTRSALVRQALEEMLSAEDPEDAEDVRISEARLADPNEGRVPWEQVRAKAGL